MIIWLSFLGVVFMLLYLHSNANNQRKKTILKWLIILVCTYFSAFRDGLGADYNQYISRLNMVDTYSLSYGLLTEPSFTLTSLLIQNTPLSTYFYFFIMSVITIVPLLLFLFKNQRPEWSIFIFITFIGCGYIQSFNVVRQFAAVAMTFVAINFLLEKKHVKYVLFVLLATFFHRSAIFMFALPLVQYLKLNKQWIAIALLLLTFFANEFNFSFLTNIKVDMQAFENSNEENLGKAASTIIVVLNLFILFIISISKQIIKSEKDYAIYSFGLMFMYSYNLSISNLIFSRMALYFAPPLYIMLTFPMKNKNIRDPYKFVLSFLFLGLLLKLFLTTNNTEVLPNRILPVTCLFD